MSTEGLAGASGLAAAVERAERYVVNVDARRWPTSALALRPEGVLVAASHAVEREEQIGLRLPDGQEASAVLVGRDNSLDLAVLKTDARLDAAELLPPSALRVGQWVVGLYRPDGRIRARQGIVEGVGEGFHTPWGGRVDASVEVDLSTRNLSAVALADAEGRPFGLYVAGGRGLLLPGPTLARVVEQILAHGRVRRGYLGIGTQPVALPEAAAQGTERRVGLLVLTVEKGSPADAAGLALGDVLVAVDGQPVEDVGDLWTILGDDRVGKPCQLTVLRTGRLAQVPLTVGQRP